MFATVVWDEFGVHTILRTILISQMLRNFLKNCSKVDDPLDPFLSDSINNYATL